MMSDSDARVVIGGRVEGYKGAMPGIAEEVLLSLKAGKPIFLVGGFGGCTRDLAETLGQCFGQSVVLRNYIAH